MPPWSARNNPLSNPPNSQHPHHHFASPPQSQSRLQQSTPRALPQDVPILPSRPVASNPMLAMASSSSSPRQRRGHTRSISHPFNGVLSGRGVGKKHNRTISKDVLMDSDDDDDGNPYEFTFTPMPLSPSPKKQLPRTPPVDGTEDFATGRCLTCSTMMRWPKNLSTFRCTECLMVNDLEVPGDNGKPAVPRKAIPISFDRTKGIIDNCIASYLRKLLEAPETRPLPIKAPGSSRLGQSPNRGNGYLSDCSSGDPQSRTPSGPSSPTRPKPGASSYPTTYQTQSLFPPSQGLPPRGRSNSDMQSSPNPGQAKPFVTEPKEPTNSNRPTLFRPVEDYIISSFKACDCLNVSFSTAQQPPQSGRDASPSKPMPDTPGGIAKVPPKGPVRPPDLGNGHSREKSTGSTRPVTSRSPRINWAELAQWYHLILTAGVSWVELWSAMQPADVYNEEDALRKRRWDTVDLTAVDREIADARFHLQRTLLKATENLLKRPRQPLRRPEDTRFLLMLLANPMLYPSSSLPEVQAAAVMPHKDKLEPPNTRDRDRPVPPNGNPSRKGQPTKQRGRGPGGHSGIIKRIMGLISSLPNEIHHYLISWFSRFSVGQFERIVDLVGGFFTYRLTRQHGRKQTESFRTDDSLIPSFSSAAGNTPAELHAAINGRNQSKLNKSEDKPTVYGDDWQILAACRVMSLLFSANNAGGQRKPDEDLDDPARRNQVINRGHLIPISSFYNTLLDYSDLVADFEGWESKTSRFSFCQYPFFLSIWAKIHILEHDARRQMEVRAREAFFSSILSRKAVSQYLVLKVRRDCLVEDSLKRISEVVWNSQQEIKKGLRVEFLGEEGVDAGGLRKEWFLLLVRDVFDPNHGLFIYDEDSQYCYFNPFCFESSEQFFLVGVLLGLAIYNSTILDIALPPFAFRKLLAAAPVQQNGPSSSSAATPRTGFKSTLDDLAEYRPALAKGLRGLLEFEGDVAETFCYDFVAQLDRYGERVAVPLCEGGEKRQVTNANRREFVDLYVQQLLDVSVTRQFQPFKRGFFTVCGGNALSLFRSEEIELLVRGSDEPLDVPSLKAVASYDNWPSAQPEEEPVVQWFWEFFENTQPASQRKILSFITGSDRIPAMGATSLSIRMTCLGDDASRYPTARTCFNMLGLYRYPTRERLERVLWEAVMNGEGFGLK